MASDFEIDKSTRDAVIAAVERHGARVVEDWNEPEGARFIGTIDGCTITLFPRFDSHFAMYFTVAHLYGHLCQLTRCTPEMERVLNLSYRLGEPMTRQEVQDIYDFEVEAAAIGRRLLEEIGPVPRELDRQYSRMFLADFHYLVNAIETGRGGPTSFEQYLRREPVPFRLIEPDPHPLLDVSSLGSKPTDVTIVL